MAPKDKDRYLINSILRSSNILRCLTKGKAHKVSEIARELRLDRSTTYRILLSLEKSGFVEKDEETGEYSLGLFAFEIGHAYLNRIDIPKVAKPIMVDLALKVQETVHLAVLSGTEIVYIDKVDSPRPLGIMSKIGQRAPLYCTSLGKVLLAFQPENELKRILDQLRLVPMTSNTIVSKRKLMEELRIVRKQGYALDNREIEDDVECIGAPILDHRGSIIAALSVSGPQRKINTPQEKQFVGYVVEAAGLISSKLGYMEGKKQEKGEP